VGGVAVILNAASGTGAASRGVSDIAQRLARAGRDGTITTVRGGRALRRAAQSALEAGCDALVAGGGDGTVSALASVTVGSEVPLGVLPLGTLNHFARDVGIPLDLEEALDVILAGRTRSVDVGEVNGRIFINNASLGVYPRIVQLRERYREKGLGKWFAALWAGLAVLRRRPFMTVRIRTAEEDIVRRTPTVLVGNNPYETAGLSIGSRSSLNQGVLALYVMNADARVSLLRLAWQVWRKGAERVREVDCLLADEALIQATRPALRAALDGEVVGLETPLGFRSRPGALRVLVP
jgi:YegS/Rv2252/BmrU family lipid kinase